MVPAIMILPTCQEFGIDDGRTLHRAHLFEDDYASALVSPEPSESRIQHSQWLGPQQLGLRSTLKPQCGKVCFIVKSGIGLGDLRLCLL
jgi:hypothetical protein